MAKADGEEEEWDGCVLADFRFMNFTFFLFNLLIFIFLLILLFFYTFFYTHNIYPRTFLFHNIDTFITFFYSFILFHFPMRLLPTTFSYTPLPWCSGEV